MPGVQKHIQNERIAAQRAHGQRVYISGLDGRHSLETGVAYHYRGHYLYAYPAGNPIEPIPFSTKKGINIIGTVQELAPIYDPNVADLVPESSIAALNKSRHHVFKEQQEAEQEARRQISQDFHSVDETMEEVGMQMPAIVRPGSQALRSTDRQVSDSRMTPLIPSQVSSHAPARWDSHVSLPTLAVHDARSDIRHSASSQALYSHGSSLQADISKRAAEAAAYYPLQRFTGSPSSMADPQLQCFMSSPHDLDFMATADPIRLQRFASDPSGLVDLNVPTFSRADSNGSLTSMAENEVVHKYRQPPLAAGQSPQLDNPDPPHLSCSISRVGSYTSLGDLSNQDAHNNFAQRIPSGLGGFRLSTRASSRPSIPTLGAYSDPEPSLEVGTRPQILCRGPSPLATATPPLSPTVSLSLHTGLANWTIHDGTYYREGGQVTAGPSLLRSPRSQSSLTSMTRQVSQDIKPSEGYVFGSTLAPLNAWMPPDYSKPCSFTPHDRAVYLAGSAPGSRLPSVAPSRTVSPDRYMNAQAQYNMRSYSSTSHLGQLLEQSVLSSRSPSVALSAVPFMGPSHDISPEKSFANMNRSAPFRHTTSNGRLNQLNAEEGRARASKPMDEIMGGSSEPWTHIHPTSILFPCPASPPTELSHMNAPPDSRSKPIGTGRPRRASIILNQVHNLKTLPITTEPTETQLGLGSVGVVSARVPKCSIHGADCDGVSVSDTWKTDRALKSGGFAAPYPIVQGEGEEKRTMVDWLELLREERDGLVSRRGLF